VEELSKIDQRKLLLFRIGGNDIFIENKKKKEKKIIDVKDIKTAMYFTNIVTDF